MKEPCEKLPDSVDKFLTYINRAYNLDLEESYKVKLLSMAF